MSFFVKPVTVWIVLDSAGNSIEIKKELNVGDQKRLEASGVRRVQRQLADGRVGFEVETDWGAFEIARAAVWLTDWAGPSFVNEDGTKTPPSLSAIKALTPEAFEQISEAIGTHVAAMEQEKKLKRTAPAPAAATPSPS